MTSIEVRWAGVEQASVERCVVDERDAGTTISGSIDLGADHVAYRVRVDRRWRFRELVLTADRRADGALLLIQLGDDGVWRVDGIPRPDLAGASEIDLAISPMSNTLPIRRRALEVGESTEIVTAYIDAAFRISRDPQRYTRIAERRYLYESLDSLFSREITVDEHGLVVDYPSLFIRI